MLSVHTIFNVQYVYAIFISHYTKDTSEGNLHVCSVAVGLMVKAERANISNWKNKQTPLASRECLFLSYMDLYLTRLTWVVWYRVYHDRLTRCWTHSLRQTCMNMHYWGQYILRTPQSIVITMYFVFIFTCTQLNQYTDPTKSWISLFQSCKYIDCILEANWSVFKATLNSFKNTMV